MSKILIDEATVKLVLEALENSVDLVSKEARNAEELYGKYPSRLARIQGLVAFEVAHEKAITALREALAEQPAQQEPVEYWNAVEGWVKIDEMRQHFDSVGCGTIYKTPGDGRVPLTTAQRKPLTDEEIMAIGKELGLKCRFGGNPNIDFDYARAIEAAHNIKENT